MEQNRNFKNILSIPKWDRINKKKKEKLEWK